MNSPLDCRDQCCTQDELAQLNQDTRDSIRGNSNFAHLFPEDGYWPSRPPSDPNIEAMIWEDAEDYS